MPPDLALQPGFPPGMRVVERGWLSSNCIVFDEGDRVSIVDTGYATHVAQTLELVGQCCRGRPLARILNTHLHSDHVGGNAALQRQHAGVRVLVPPGLAAAVDAWDIDALTYAPTGQQCERFRRDGILPPGSTIDLGAGSWQIVGAPGHDPHMVMLFDPASGILLSADALWEHGFGAIFPEIEGESGFEEQRAALDAIARLSPRIVVPGHGRAFTSVGEALQRARERLDALASSPPRNARHVLKVLVKFWLLQVRTTRDDELLAHFGAARYARIVHERYFAADSFEAMMGRAVAELAAAGAARIDGARIDNVD